MSTPARHPVARCRGHFACVGRPMAALAVLCLVPAVIVGVASAGPPLSPQQALDRSTAVFEGRVVELRSAEGRLHVQLAVTRTWRGPEREMLEVSAPIEDACGLSLTLDTAYLIYAVGPAASLTTDGCGGTKRMLEAEADLVMLGVGAVPVDAPAESEREDDPEPPARGGCASCNIGAPAQPSAGSRGDAPAPQLALGALLAMLVLRQRCRPGPRR